jgi:hypothetical protein
MRSRYAYVSPVGVSLVGLLAATFGATNAAAQTTRTDVQVWPSSAVTAPIGDRLEIRADGLLQIIDDTSRVGRELARVVVVGKLTDQMAVGAGYTWTHVDDGAGGHAVEHRAVQEIDLRTPVTISAFVISSRTRLEERRREHVSTTAVRLRQLTRLDVPLGTGGVRAVAWNEYFHSINTTAWSGRSGPGLMLNFVGLRVPVTSRMAIEPGYLNQTNFVAGRNQSFHVVALFFTARF